MDRQFTPNESCRNSNLRSRPMKAGHQSQGPLWSTLEKICALLGIPSVPSASDTALFQHMQFKTGQRIHRIGQPFDTLYVVNSGFLKTALIDEFGNEQVLSFPMKGDIVGMDAIHTNRHLSETRTQSETDLILLPFKRLQSLSRANPEIENFMYHVISRELALRQAVISMLGTMSAEARVARFLVALSDRFAEMGYSSKLFNLRMTRQEIGNHLGLTLETISRTMSAFNAIGLIAVHLRSVAINDQEALRALCRVPRFYSRRDKLSEDLSRKEVATRDSRVAS